MAVGEGHKPWLPACCSRVQQGPCRPMGQQGVQRVPPAYVGWEGTCLNTEPGGFLGATEQRAEPARCTRGGERALRLAQPGPLDPETCRVGNLPGPDTVINALMAAKPLCKHALISDTERSAGTCERACGLGAATPQSSVDTAPD